MMKTDTLSDTEKQQVQEGIALLRKTFDNNWLQNESRIGHPLLYYIANTAAWSQYWLSDLGRKIEALRTLPKFGDLESRLKDSNEYQGAIAEIDSAYKLLKVGFQIELAPPIGRGKRKADLKAILGKYEIFLEISALTASKKQLAAVQTMNLLSYPFQFNNDMHVYFQIHKILSKPRISEFRSKIEKAIEDVKVSKGSSYIGEPNVLDYLRML